MKELELEFEGRGEVKGYHFKQVMKSDTAYMYQKTFEDLVNYEVFERRENLYFDCISYPNSPSFGMWAWDFKDIDKAIAKFNEL